MSSDRDPAPSPATLAVAAGRPARDADAPLAVPPVLSSTYHAGGPMVYGRDGNPTWESFEAVLAALEGGGSSLLFSSGMGAITAVLETLPVGAVVVAPDQGYAKTRGFLEERAALGRFSLRLVDVSDTDAVLRALDGAACVWLESITNPGIDVCDVATVAAAARSVGALSVCDNTFLTPLRFRPLDAGVDVALHSVTKFLAGHSDVVLGAVTVRDDALLDGYRRQRSHYGAIAGPVEAWLALRGIRTLAVRMDRAEANALELARRLQAHPAVTRVRYPGLPEDPWHARAAAQFSGCGAVLAFEVRGGADGAEAVAGAVRLAVHATSLGGVETTIERRRRWAGESERTPVELLRLSVGIEDVEDLWDDLAQALEHARG